MTEQLFVGFKEPLQRREPQVEGGGIDVIERPNRHHQHPPHGDDDNDENGNQQAVDQNLEKDIVPGTHFDIHCRLLI